MRVVHCLYLGLMSDTAKSCVILGLRESAGGVMHHAASKLEHVEIEASHFRLAGPFLEDSGVDRLFEEAAQTLVEFLTFHRLVSASYKTGVVRLDAFRSWAQLGRIIFTVMAVQIAQLLPSLEEMRLVQSPSSLSSAVGEEDSREEATSTSTSSRRARQKRAAQRSLRQRHREEMLERLDRHITEHGIVVRIEKTFVVGFCESSESDSSESLGESCGASRRSLSA